MTADRVVLVCHNPLPADDRVRAYLVKAGYTVDVRRPYDGDALGDVGEDVAGTVVYGGMFNAYDFDDHPFLRHEDRWIGECLGKGLPTLGICQGAQQIALHLGAEVGPKPDEVMEFGCYTIDPVEGADDFLEKPLWVTQAHFHTFAIPDSAERLASSELFENQAFRYGRNVYGLQFHPEVTVETFSKWQSEDNVNYTRPGAQSKETQDRLLAAHGTDQAGWFNDFLAKLFPERALD